MLLFGKMVSVMRKGDALVNAQSVFSWAVLFGHGRLHELTNWCTEIGLNVHFPYDQFDHDREFEKFKSVVMAGAEFKWEDSPDLQIWVLRITWRYSQ